MIGSRLVDGAPYGVHQFVWTVTAAEVVPRGTSMPSPVLPAFPPAVWLLETVLLPGFEMVLFAML
jgi:hypothetical protein